MYAQISCIGGQCVIITQQNGVIGKICTFDKIKTQMPSKRPINPCSIVNAFLHAIIYSDGTVKIAPLEISEVLTVCQQPVLDTLP